MSTSYDVDWVRGTPSPVRHFVSRSNYLTSSMQLRLPWILSRRRLIFAVVVDDALFALLYYALYHYFFDIWPSFSPLLVILLAIWTLSSYVVGRYSPDAESVCGNYVSSIVGRQLVGTGFVLLLTLCATLLYFLTFNRYTFLVSFRSFLIPFLGSLSVASFFFQLSLRRWVVLQDLERNWVWSYVGSSSGCQQLQEMLRWSRFQVCIRHVMPSELGHQDHSSQFIVDHFHDQPASLLESLYRLQQRGSTVLSRLSWCEVYLQRFPSELLSEADLLDGCFSMPHGTLQSRLKRVGDLVIASLLLVITSPLILFSALLIKCSDGGPVFYSQLRTGLGGTTYTIWKLRTMRIDAEQHGAQWSSRSDSRITRVGSILRRTRLDELPQLWCVLTGAMSLIGPRPERPEFYQELSRRIPYYNLRHLIRPGLSGWAQVNYPYGASVEDSANKLSYDLFYLKNFSFLLDLLILFKTIKLVLNAQGALPKTFSKSGPAS